MTKQEFINKLAEQEGVDKKQAAAWVDALLKALTEALIAGEKVQFIGFGAFEVRQARREESTQSPDRRGSNLPGHTGAGVQGRQGAQRGRGREVTSQTMRMGRGNPVLIY